jgi:hypothetical protein
MKLRPNQFRCTRRRERILLHIGRHWPGASERGPLATLARMEISVHDNFLVSYEVLCEQHEIRLHTEFRDRQPIERTDVIFRGVEAYHFYRDNFQTIIFDITEDSAEGILAEDSARFEEGRRYSWPGPWNNSDAAIKAHLKERGVRGFSLSSSFGMCGWILALSMARILRDGPDP